MKFYLKYLNPLVSVLIFLLCLYASGVESAAYKFKLADVFAGGIPTYFLAKGVFCGLAIFLLGKILELLIHNQNKVLNK